MASIMEIEVMKGNIAEIPPLFPAAGFGKKEKVARQWGREERNQTKQHFWSNIQKRKTR
jgi:hypothetical protein